MEKVDKSRLLKAHRNFVRGEDCNKPPVLIFNFSCSFVKIYPYRYFLNRMTKRPTFWCVSLISLDAMTCGVDLMFW